MNEEKQNEQKAEGEKPSSLIESEVLVEKVRKLEREKAENSEARKLDKNNTSKILNEKRELSEPLDETEAKRRMSQKSRRGFLVGGAAALVGVFGWRWMPDEAKEKLLRRTFKFNERVSQIFYSPKCLAPRRFARQRRRRNEQRF